MIQQPENKPYSLEEILKILRSQAASLPPSPTSSRYLRALQSLESSYLTMELPNMGGRFDFAQAKDGKLKTEDGKLKTENGKRETENGKLKTLLTDWLVNQWLIHTPFSTSSLYLDIISSLYGAAVKQGLLPKTTLFSQLKVSLKDLGPNGWKSGIDDEIFERALRLTKNAACLISDDAIAADIVLWSLTHTLQPLQDIALTRREDIVGDGNSDRQTASLMHDDPIVQAIMGRHCANARRKYLFPLRQTERTPKQLEKHIAKIVNALFKRARLPQATDPFQTVEALWSYAALRVGVPASAIVSHLGHAPLGLPVLKLSVVRLPLSEQSLLTENSQRKTENGKRKTDNAPFSQVGKVFLDNPPRWYAMSLRPGVRFTQLCRRFEILADRVPQPRLFYPCEEIARAIGKKIVIRQRPFIHSVVFFEAKLTDIGRIFGRIGDLAWCYRQSARPGAPYADISEAQFHLFQQTIATFTPDYEVAPSGELELKKNDRVQIVGGLFAGHEAIMEGRFGFPQAKTSPNRPAPVSDNGKQSTETGQRKTENAPNIVYRLNIIGDNGIEWRINLDPRLAAPK